ncbi:MAG: YIP1 family protein [Bacteroidales bacterium]|nr:YIP1 family protein [Bacteroidales bacterium]
MINRIKNILVSPKTEWPTIEAENAPHAKVFTSYVVPLALIPAIAAFIGYGLIGYSVWGVRISSMDWGIRQAIVQLISMYGGVYLTAFIVNALADNFGAKKDFNRAFSLVAYAYTPMFVGGICYILPSLWWLASLCGIYGLYLLYIGLQPMMKAPAEKQSSYFVISLIATVAVAAILSMVMTAVLLRGMGGMGSFNF